MNLLLLLLVFVSSCNDERETYGDKGNILLSVSMSDAPLVETKASSGLPNGWNPAEDCLIQLFKGEDLVDSYDGLSKLPSQLTLEIGEYTLKVTAGQKADASFNVCYYEGEETFSVTAGETEAVTLACKLKNTLATVEFSSALEAVLSSDSKVYVVGNIGAQLDWTIDNNAQTGYFILSGQALSWAFEGKVNGKNVSVANTISPANPNTNYVLNFEYDESGLDTPEGGLIFKLVVIEPEPDDDTIDYDPEGIQLEGDGFDLSNPKSIIEGTSQNISVNVSSSSQITSFVVQVDAITKSAFGLEESSFDFIGMSMGELSAYEAKGLYFQSSILVRSGENTEKNTYSLTILSDKVKELVQGEYSFDILLANEKGNNAQSQLKVLIIEDAEAVTDDLSIADVWAKSATLRGTLVKGSLGFAFEYRIDGTSEWSTISAILEDDQQTLFAKATNLTPETTYQYRVIAGVNKGEVKTFTTQQASQLPNSGFEDWTSTSSWGTVVWYAASNTSNLFWDSGNKGTSMLLTGNINVTKYDEDIYRSGSRSARLKSQYVGLGGGLGRFAAGNLYSGSYGKTVGTSGAQLNWGRPFTARPTKLVGYYRYSPGVIDYTEEDLPDEFIADGALEGATDKGVVFIALGEWESSLLIDNTDRPGSLFSADTTEGIIAYGEFVMDTEATPQDGSFLRFEIELDYRDLTKIPTQILVVCSSSKWGDYFTGGSGSTLYLDDFELIYE